MYCIVVLMFISLKIFLELHRLFSQFVEELRSYLNNRVFLSRNYRLLPRGNLMFLKQIFAREAKLQGQMC